MLNLKFYNLLCCSAALEVSWAKGYRYWCTGTPPAKHLMFETKIALRNFLHARVVMRRPTHNTAKLPRQLLEELGVKGTGLRPI